MSDTIETLTTEQFLELLAPDGRVTFQTFDDYDGDDRAKNKKLARIFFGTFAQHEDTLRELNENGAGIFCMVNRGDGKGRSAKNVVDVRALFLDLDGAPLDPVLDCARECGVEPHALIESSPGRWHVYWRVTDCRLDHFAQLQQRLAAKFGGDTSVHDLCRVMRLPGFEHRKGAPFLTRVFHLAPSLPPYKVADIDRLAQTTTASVANQRLVKVRVTVYRDAGYQEWDAELERDRKLYEIEGRIPDGRRNNTIVSLAGKLRSDGLSPTAIAAALHVVNKERIDPPLERALINDIAERSEKWRAGVIGPTTEDPHGPLDIFEEAAAPPLRAADFPRAIANFAEKQARAAGHDFSAYAMACLTVVAGATTDEARIRVDGRTEHFESARLWTMLFGPPGSAKSPAISAAMRPLYDVHAKLREQFAANKAAKGEDGLGDNRKSERPPVAFVNDPTVEALSEILATTRRGVLLVTEELDSWLGSHDAYRNAQGSKDRGDYLKGFDGGPHQIERIQRGSILVANWGVSILGAATPAALQRHARNLPADGLIQRFLPVSVRPMTKPDLSITHSQLEISRRACSESVSAAYAVGPGVVALSPEAQHIFEQRRDELREEVRAVAVMSAPFAGHLAKHSALLGRVALTMHIAEHGRASLEEPVSGDTMARTVRLLRRLAVHAITMYDTLGGVASNSALPLARDLAHSILASRLDGGGKGAFIQCCRAFRKADEREQRSAMTILEDAGWLLPDEGARTYRGWPAGWIVVPTVHTAFAQRAEQHRAIRRLVLERVHQKPDDAE